MLFARCSHCQTVFQVTAPQLEAANGFVRCGRCQKAFCALDHLTDEHGQPVERQSPSEGGVSNGFIHISGDQPEIAAPVAPAQTHAHPVVVEIIGSLAHFTRIAPYAALAPSHPKAATQRATTGAGAAAATGTSLSPGASAPVAAPGAASGAASGAAEHPTSSATHTVPGDPAPTAPTPDPQQAASALDPALNPASIDTIPTLFLTATLDELAMLKKRSEKSARTFYPRMDALVTWLLVDTLLVFVLAAQLGFMARDYTVNFPPLRPGLELLCHTIGCILPPRRDLAAFAILDRNVTVHPKSSGALLVELIFANQAEFRQPMPLIEFSLLDPSGEPTAWRQFTPAAYLAGAYQDATWAEPNQPVLLQLEIMNPGGEIENYRFRFL